MSISLLEQLVFSKPYFDRMGFLVAERDGNPIGFAHAAFGPTADHDGISPEVGVVCMVMTLPGPDQDEVQDQLLAAAEQYLCQRGARKIYGGGVWPFTPFYLGLYGGSSLPGVLHADFRLERLYRRAGYQPEATCEVWQRELSGFRSRVDRRHMRIRREYVIEAAKDEPLGTWWEACVLDQAFHVRFRLVPKSGGTSPGFATLWDMEPLASGWGIQAMGLVEVVIDPDCRRQGFGSFLLGEVLRQLQSEGVTMVQCQSLSSNHAARGLFRSLGFRLQETGIVFHKEVPETDVEQQDGAATAV